VVFTTAVAVGDSKYEKWSTEVEWRWMTLNFGKIGYTKTDYPHSNLYVGVL